MSAAVDAPRFREAVLDWYAANGRRLNFRQRRDPYSVLVAEVIAQQTQISRVEPAWTAFLARFPDVFILATASPADVLRQWQGLGYNRRALNLHRAARAVVEQYAGAFPDDVESLTRLPGVGPYTARAVAAIAFGRRIGAVDTNVRRVLGRSVLGEAEAPAGIALQALADDLVPEGRSAEWTHALMDIGALFCRPRGPRCEGCPLREQCRYRAVATGANMPRRSLSAGAFRSTSAKAFRSTNRWLRGRLIDYARAATDDAWIRIDVGVGEHDPDVAARAARQMAGEGLLELHPTDPGLARLPR